MMPEWVLIAARDRNGVIGVKGELPWYLPNDFRHFKQTTLGHPVIMGRKTFESIGKPLPGRRNVVMTRDPQFQAEGVECVSSTEEAGKLFAADETVFVIGGGEIYRQFLPSSRRVILTEVDMEVEEGDAWFPELNPEAFQEVSRETHPADERHSVSYAFVEYAKID